MITTSFFVISFFNSAGVMRRAVSPGGNACVVGAGVLGTKSLEVRSLELQAARAITPASTAAPTDIKRRMKNLQATSRITEEVVCYLIADNFVKCSVAAFGSKTRLNQAVIPAQDRGCVIDTFCLEISHRTGARMFGRSRAVGGNHLVAR